MTKIDSALVRGPSTVGSVHDMPSSAPTQIDLYWRPGCGFCSMLRRQLDNAGIERVEHNIWDDPVDAATVREFAAGNETVPTVVVGEVGLVNPSARQVADLLEQHAPHLLPDDYEPAPPSRVERLVGKLLGT